MTMYRMKITLFQRVHKLFTKATRARSAQSFDSASTQQGPRQGPSGSPPRRTSHEGTGDCRRFSSAVARALSFVLGEVARTQIDSTEQSNCKQSARDPVWVLSAAASRVPRISRDRLSPVEWKSPPSDLTRGHGRPRTPDVAADSDLLSCTMSGAPGHQEEGKRQSASAATAKKLSASYSQTTRHCSSAEKQNDLKAHRESKERTPLAYRMQRVPRDRWSPTDWKSPSERWSPTEWKSPSERWSPTDWKSPSERWSPA